ncbi:MAG: hypothetical protein MGF17_16155, partial [Trichodesmium sp. MAG_R04]|nr:hypothetical protein [Trichodesmium sp. MAG_R04]
LGINSDVWKFNPFVSIGNQVPFLKSSTLNFMDCTRSLIDLNLPASCCLVPLLRLALNAPGKLNSDS